METRNPASQRREHVHFFNFFVGSFSSEYIYGVPFVKILMSKTQGFGGILVID